MLETTMGTEAAALRFYQDQVNEELAQEEAERAQRKGSYLAPEGLYGARCLSYEPADMEKLFDSERNSGATFYSTTWEVTNEAGQYEIRYVKLTPTKWINSNGKTDMSYINARNLFAHGGVEEFLALLEWARHNTVPVKVTVATNGKRNYMSIQRPGR